jgi:hypothetical protein
MKTVICDSFAVYEWDCPYCNKETSTAEDPDEREVFCECGMVYKVETEKGL